ncbi:hypothetical protein CWB99_19975, partial [Pseudoalteromonas rubra]
MADFYKVRKVESIEFDDFIECLNDMQGGFFDVCNINKTISLLSKLYNNRVFLASFLNDFLKDIASQKSNLYTFQVFMLSKQKHFDIRAPIWIPPSGQESDSAFVYDLPHDHNFDLMTLGYLVITEKH